jgi:hypothetical protein
MPNVYAPAAEIATGIVRPVEIAFIQWIRRHSPTIFFALVVIGSLRIAATDTVFSSTWDEPNHIAVGTEWLTDGTLQLDYSHPPLARVAAALGPYLAQGRPGLPPASGYTREWDSASFIGLAILHRGGVYDRNLALARLGVLPFFWIACATVYLWTRRYLGEPATAFAVFLFTFLPPVLAHAGLATTDMAITAFVGASFLMALYWIEKPDLSRSLLLGIIIGLAVLSKFSALPFIPAAIAGAVICHIVGERSAPLNVLPVRKYLAPLCLGLLTCSIVVWAGYRFAFGMMNSPGFSFPVPAPEFFEGLRNLVAYNTKGHASFLLGRHSMSGWWYFFPVTLALKTPLPFLALLLLGAFAVTGRSKGVRLALGFSSGIVLFAMTSHLNLGVRHVLPAYVGFSIVAAAGAQRLLTLSGRVKWAGWILGALIIWMTATSCLSHPDYLPYVNALAGSRPENALVDSDLDWGQDVKRLGARLRELGAKSVAFTPYNPVDLASMGFPTVVPETDARPTPGWNAVSLTRLKLSEGPGRAIPWQETIVPQEKTGKGIWLWYFPPQVVDTTN